MSDQKENCFKCDLCSHISDEMDRLQQEQQLSSLRIQLEVTTKQFEDAERDLLAQHPLIADLKARLECRKIATEQQIIGALKSAIVAHGPITLDLMESAAKRLFGAMGTERIDELTSSLASMKQELAYVKSHHTARFVTDTVETLRGLMQYMGQTCDENDVTNGVMVEDVHVPSLRFHAAWLKAAELLDVLTPYGKFKLPHRKNG